MTIMLTDMLAEILGSPTPRLSLKQRGGVGKEMRGAWEGFNNVQQRVSTTHHGEENDDYRQQSQ